MPFFLASAGCGELVYFGKLQLTSLRLFFRRQVLLQVDAVGNKKTEVQMTCRKFDTITFSLLVYMLKSFFGHSIDHVYDLLSIAGVLFKITQ